MPLDWSLEDKFDLGLYLEEWDTVIARFDSDDSLYVYGVCYQDDKIADREKHARMKKVFNKVREKSFIDREIKDSELRNARLEDSAHSSLIRHWEQNNSQNPSEVRRIEISAFLEVPKTFSDTCYSTGKCKLPKK